MKVVDFEIRFEELTGRSEKLERLTRTRNDGKFVRCASPLNSHCLNRKGHGCCGDQMSSFATARESISASETSGRKGRKESTPAESRKGDSRRRQGRFVSAAEELACVLLFGHSMSELLESDDR